MLKNEIETTNNDFNKIYKDIKKLINESKNRIYISVNTEILNLYWNIGKIIIEIQNGENRAKYGKNVLKDLSMRLTKEFGNGFSERNLEHMRKFYLIFPISKSVIAKLSWTHYIEIMKIKEDEKRNFYIHECINSKWSVRELQRQIKSKMYERMIKDKKNIDLNHGLTITEGKDFVKDPYILEFLNIKSDYTEKELENNIIDHIKEFLLELGRGYSLVGRQIRITIENNHYYADLVFYNSIVKSYLVIDLKIGKLKPKDIGQLLMYVSYFDKDVKEKSDNDTIGLLLCTDKNDIIVKYTLPKNSNIYVSKYLLHLPSEEELTTIIEEEINNFK